METINIDRLNIFFIYDDDRGYIVLGHKYNEERWGKISLGLYGKEFNIEGHVYLEKGLSISYYKKMLHQNFFELREFISKDRMEKVRELVKSDYNLGYEMIVELYKGFKKLNK